MLGVRRCARLLFLCARALWELRSGVCLCVCVRLRVCVAGQERERGGSVEREMAPSLHSSRLGDSSPALALSLSRAHFSTRCRIARWVPRVSESLARRGRDGGRRESERADNTEGENNDRPLSLAVKNSPSRACVRSLRARAFTRGRARAVFGAWVPGWWIALVRVCEI